MTMAEAEKKPVSGIFEIVRQGDTLIVVPLTDLREFEYQLIEYGARDVLDLLTVGPAKNVIMDFYRTEYYGSTALSFFLKLWTRVTKRNGRMAFCNLSEHERNTLRVTRLDHLWSICATREDALRSIASPDKVGS
jgi:anti-anti-sigma factor